MATSIVPTTTTSFTGFRVTLRSTTVRSTTAPPTVFTAYFTSASPGTPAVRIDS